MSWENDTQLLLHMDGANGSTTFIDETSKAVTAVGTAQISTAVAKFNQSGLFDGNSDYLTLVDAAAWDFGTDPFTLEGFVYLNAGGAYVQRIISFGSQADGANNHWTWGIGYANNMNLAYWNGAGYTDYGYNFGTNWGTGSWIHVALCRSGANLYFFNRGTLMGTGSLGAGVALNAGASGLILGARYNVNSGDVIEYFNGYMDEVRIIKGVALWTANFTPPVLPYGGAPVGSRMMMGVGC